MAEPLGGYRPLTELEREYGYSRTHIRNVCVRHGIPILDRYGRSWVAPEYRKRLRKLLPPRATAKAVG